MFFIVWKFHTCIYNIFWSNPPPIFSPSNSSPTQHPLPPANFTCSFLKTYWVHFVMPACAWAQDSLLQHWASPGWHHLDKTDFPCPSNHSLPIAPQVRARFHEPLPIHACWDFGWQVRERTYIWSHCVFMCAMALLCPTNTLSHHVSCLVHAY